MLIVRFEVLTAVIMKNTVFWDVASCRSSVNRCFGGTYRLHLQDRKSASEEPAWAGGLPIQNSRYFRTNSMIYKLYSWNAVVEVIYWKIRLERLYSILLGLLHKIIMGVPCNSLNLLQPVYDSFMALCKLGVVVVRMAENRNCPTALNGRLSYPVSTESVKLFIRGKVRLWPSAKWIL
jgi:hypothetical protein